MFTKKKNMNVDGLSKVGLHLDAGVWHILESLWLAILLNSFTPLFISSYVG